MSVRELIILGSSSQQPTRYRNPSAYLFRWNEEGLLFDVGEGTQRQFIYANTPPTCVTRIFISHFHGDHCSGLGPMIMRLNLDKVPHPVHIYYPKSGKKYFQRLRYGAIYHEAIQIIEHPVAKSGVVHDDGKFCIEATFLEHGIDTIGWRVTEADRRKFDRKKLEQFGVKGPMVRELEQKGSLVTDQGTVTLDDVSWIRKGDTIAMVSDTRYCEAAIQMAKGAKMIVCESTYREEHKELAANHFHLTAKQAATIAKEAGGKHLILTHFSGRYLKTEEFLQEAREIFPNTDAAEDLKVFPFPRE